MGCGHKHIPLQVNDKYAPVGKGQHDSAAVGIKRGDGRVVVVVRLTGLKLSKGRQPGDATAVLRICVAVARGRRNEAVVAGWNVNQSIVLLPTRAAEARSAGGYWNIRFTRTPRTAS